MFYKGKTIPTKKARYILLISEITLNVYCSCCVLKLDNVNQSTSLYDIFLINCTITNLHTLKDVTHNRINYITITERPIVSINFKDEFKLPVSKYDYTQLKDKNQTIEFVETIFSQKKLFTLYSLSL